MTKNAGKACNNRLYRHIRTFEKIVKNYFVIYPKVVGKSVGLPGLLVLMAVTIGGGAFGVLGMLFSVPVCAVLYSLYLEFMQKSDAGS